MKTLLRCCAAATLAAAVTACGEVPTGTETMAVPVRRDGGVIIGGHHIADSDSIMVTTLSSGPATPGASTCLEGDGGGIFGGGHATEDPACE